MKKEYIMNQLPLTKRNHYEYPLIIKKLLNTPMRYAKNQEIIYRDNTRFTYTTLFERINRLASGLDALGVKSGDIVGVMDYNSHRFLESYFAVPMMGATLAMFNWRFALEELEYTITHARPKILLVHADFLPILEKIEDSLSAVEKIVLICDDDEKCETSLSIAVQYETMLDEAFRSYDFKDMDENTTATLYYTAGTTGLPKGVFFSHRQIVLQTLSLAISLSSFGSNVRFESDDVFLPLATMWSEHGWGMPYLATMLGVKQVYSGKYDPDNILRIFKEHGITFSVCIPTVLHMMLSHPQSADVDLSNCKLLIVGAHLDRGLAKTAMERGLEVVSAFGMSETCPLISVANPKPNLDESDIEKKLDMVTSAGLAAPLVELEVVDPLGHPHPHDGHSVGEIVMRAPWLTKGYYNDPKKSRDLWRNGWLYSADLGYIDPEGYLHVTERVKDIIKSGGEWISALKIENLVRRHKGIQDVAVVGVPSEKWGERPVVLAVVKPESVDTLTEEKIKAFMRKFADSGEIPKFSLPDRYVIVDEIPKTGVKKIDFRKIRKNLGSDIES